MRRAHPRSNRSLRLARIASLLLPVVVIPQAVAVDPDPYASEHTVPGIGGAAAGHGLPLAVFPNLQRETSPAHPAYALTDHNGNGVSSETFTGRYQLLTFGYTSCPDVCPVTLSTIAAVLEMLGAQADQLQPIFISVDPARDTRDVLAAYVGHFHPRLLGLRGSPGATRQAADQFRVRYWRESAAPDTSGAYSMAHTASLFLLDPDGNLLVQFPYGMPAEAIVEKLTTYLNRAAID